MGKYKIALSDRAKDHLSEWEKSGQLIALKIIEFRTTKAHGVTFSLFDLVSYKL